MGEREQQATDDSLEDVFEPALGELDDEVFGDDMPLSTEKQRLAAKRRRAERRLEEKRLREELGYYDLELEDF